MMHNVAVVSGAACVIYVIVLNIFRLSVFENDSIIQSIIEVVTCCGLVAMGWYSDLLPDSIETFGQILIINVSYFYAFRMHKYYVSGKKYTQEKLEGKVYIITGSNTGLGFETAKHIVSMGGIVVLACRSVEKATLARAQIMHITKCPEKRVFVSKLDLCGFDSIRKFVLAFRQLNLPLHGLVNNAGVMMQDRALTQDGFETVFTANHLSHFLLTNLLLPELEKTKGRVVNVTSSLHKSLNKFDFDDVMSERNYSLFGTYSQSKLANILFTAELQKRLSAKGSKVTCNAVHPGCVNTEVTRNMSVIMRFLDYLASPLLVMLRKTPAEGAYTSIFVATSPEIEGIGGKYFYHCAATTPGACARDQIAAERLWKLSETLTGLTSDKDE